jgi:N utilization substance protein B
MGQRHLGRELALKALYQLDLCGDPDLGRSLSLFFDNFPAHDKAREFARVLVRGTLAEKDVLDRHLTGVLEHWSIGRLSRIDHNILRLALFELTRLSDVPARVTMDEAIELAKRYGDRDSGQFVNGVLDRLAEQLGLKGKGDETIALEDQAVAVKSD